jgi:hypothetical protein
LPLEDRDQEKSRRDPEELVEGVHRQPGAEGEDVRRDEGGEGRYPLGVPSPTEFPSHQAREHYHYRSGEGGQEVERDERIAEHGPRGAGDEDHEGREVHVAEVQPLAGDEVIELVPEVSVISRGEQV